MNIRQYAKDFNILVFTEALEPGATIKMVLAQAGYETFLCSSWEKLIDQVKQNPPHLIVLDYKLSSELEEVTQVLQINSEIQWLILTESDWPTEIFQQKQMIIADLIFQKNLNESDLALYTLWSIDRACERLFLFYQNEQLIQELKKSNQNLKPTLVEPSVPVITVFNTEKILREFKTAATFEDLIQKFLDFQPVDTSLIYFKFLPAMQAFVATHSLGFSQEQVQGVGCQISNYEASALSGDLILGKLPESLTTILQNGFKKQSYRAHPLFVNNQLEGVVVYLQTDPVILTQDQQNLISLFVLCYNNLYLEKKVNTLDVKDYVTELGNRSLYFKTLQLEVQRAKRTKKPIALIKVAIDQIYEIEQVYGESIRDSLFKKLADVLIQTSRIHDTVCRTQFNEFALLLPDCSKTGAVLKAERIRRIVAKQSWLENRIKLTLSLGISEYPTLSIQHESLDEGASKALVHIQDKSGNKICVYKPISQHEPDFSVEERN